MVKNKQFLKLIFTFLIAVSVQSVAADDGELVFSITDWNTGILEHGIVVEQAVDISNKTNATVLIDLVTTCSCMMVEPESFEIPVGTSGRFIIYFDSSDDEGEFEKLLIIQTDSDTMPKGFFVVTGSVKSSIHENAETIKADDPGNNTESGSELTYYYTPGCKSCNRFIKDAELPIKTRDITEAEYFEELQSILKERGTALNEVPVLISGSRVFQGEEAIEAGYEAILEGRPSENGESAGDTGAEGTVGINMSTLAVLAAGLLDGVNPCAFTTLIFLLSALSVAGRSRRETLVIGLFFTVTVFVTYYLIGIGFFKILRIADSFELVSRIIRWLLFGVLLLFSGLSFYDFIKIRAGKTSEILLQLPDGVKRRMHSSIRSYSKSAALAGSSIVMGFLISIFELGCTGQIYFPTITYIIQTEKAASGYIFLAVYNLAFILPLVVVFVVAYMGITSKKITKIFQTKLGLIKILTGLLFLGFAVLMLVL